MRKIIISFIAMLLALYGTVAFGSYPMKEEVPAPLSQGRADTLLQFTSGGHVLGFTPNRVYMAGMGHALTEEFIGANTVTPKSVSSHRVVYENLWKGISLTYEARKTGIAESIYTVNPGADVNSIRIRYNAEVTIQKNGTLSFTHPIARGSYTLSPPVAWQEKEGTRIPVPISYTRLTDTTIGFTVGSYDRTLPLVIDPVYTWHTFHGSGGDDYGQAIAVDNDGNVYVTGYSDATWGTPVNPHSGAYDIVVFKLNSSGTLQWHTFHGSSSNNDYGQAIAVDNDGNVYVTGTSYATWGKPINPHSGNDDMVVFKLNSSGTLLWHTFYGSSDSDYGLGIAVDNDGNVYVTGTSECQEGASSANTSEGAIPEKSNGPSGIPVVKNR